MGARQDIGMVDTKEGGEGVMDIERQKDRQRERERENRVTAKGWREQVRRKGVGEVNN